MRKVFCREAVKKFGYSGARVARFLGVTASLQIHPGEKVHYLIKDDSAKNKEERVRVFPLLSADDLYDEEKYREFFIRVAEEVLGG